MVKIKQEGRWLIANFTLDCILIQLYWIARMLFVWYFVFCETIESVCQIVGRKLKTTGHCLLKHAGSGCGEFKCLGNYKCKLNLKVSGIKDIMNWFHCSAYSLWWIGFKRWHWENWSMIDSSRIIGSSIDISTIVAHLNCAQQLLHILHIWIVQVTLHVNPNGEFGSVMIHDIET